MEWRNFREQGIHIRYQIGNLLNIGATQVREIISHSFSGKQVFLVRGVGFVRTLKKSFCETIYNMPKTHWMNKHV